MRAKITDPLVRTLPTPAKGETTVFDTDTAGFGARVTSNGVRAFFLNYRTRAGRLRRYTIGRFPDWQTTTARGEAKRLKQLVRANGLDPLADLEAERAAPTMASLATRYLEEHSIKRRPSTQEDNERIFRTYILPAWSNRKVAEITFSDVDGLHRRITKSGAKHRANRVVALLSKAFNLAIRWGWRTDNPCRGIERNPEPERNRYMTGEELERLTVALKDFDDQEAANVIRLLLFTGARKGETLAAKWADFDLDAGTWTKPGATTKQATEHRIPLSAAARQLLASMDQSSEYLFPGRYGQGHRVDLKKPWPAICKAANLKGVRIHDLRHTYASILASSGQSLPIIGALLVHTQPSTTARYAHLIDDPLRAATETAGAVIQGGKRAQVRSVG